MCDFDDHLRGSLQSPGKDLALSARVWQANSNKIQTYVFTYGLTLGY